MTTWEELDRIRDAWLRTAEQVAATLRSTRNPHDLREPGEAFCATCPDHEACLTGWPCSLVLSVHKGTSEGQAPRRARDTPSPVSDTTPAPLGRHARKHAVYDPRQETPNG